MKLIFRGEDKMRNLFDDRDEPPARIAPLKGKPQQADLFSPGLGWQIVMEDYCRENGLRLEAQRMDQTFRAGGRWWSVERETPEDEYEVRPLLTEAAYAAMRAVHNLEAT